MAYGTLDRLESSVKPEELFKFIAKRQPIVIKGLPNDEDFKATQWVDFEYLKSKAGDTEVLVEPIHPASRQYGSDVERISVSFRDFLASLESADGPHHYLTTQYSEQDEDEHTMLPPPANALTDDFPLVPKLMGNLSLQQVNLWVGKSKEGSTSGLHHDFHDNLYCLLQGRKRFVLYPPQELPNLYPYGTLDTIHSNGLISYKDAPVRADGLPLRLALQTRIRAIEQKLDSLPKEDVKRKGKGKGKGRGISKERKALMEMHDQALDELAQMALDGEGGFGMEDEVDDFDALMAGLDGEDDEEEAGRSVLDGDGERDDEDEDEKDGDEDEEDEAEDEGQAPADNDETSSEPPSFSRIPTALVHKHLDLPTTAVAPTSPTLTDFPNLSKACSPYVVDLNAGEMLFLPASWWHEVTSFSGDGNGVHMAFNYWFYPPTSDSFEEPYEDSLVWEYLKGREREKAGESKNRQNGTEERVDGKKRKTADEPLQDSKSKKIPRKQ